MFVIKGKKIKQFLKWYKANKTQLNKLKLLINY